MVKLKSPPIILAKTESDFGSTPLIPIKEGQPILVSISYDFPSGKNMKILSIPDGMLVPFKINGNILSIPSIQDWWRRIFRDGVESLEEI